MTSPASYSKYRRRRQDKYLRQCQRLAQMRSAKARKRQALIDAGLLELEPKMERVFRVAGTLSVRFPGLRLSGG